MQDNRNVYVERDDHLFFNLDDGTKVLLSPDDTYEAYDEGGEWIHEVNYGIKPNGLDKLRKTKIVGFKVMVGGQEMDETLDNQTQVDLLQMLRCI